MSTVLAHPTEILLLLFLVITFLQSGIDKIYDWKGNLNWLKGHFADTPLQNLVPFLLGVVLLSEVISGILCSIGIYEIVMTGEHTFAFSGAVMSCVSLLMLLFGQRVAKDYEGAKTIVVYFIPAIFLVYILAA